MTMTMQDTELEHRSTHTARRGRDHDREPVEWQGRDGGGRRGDGLARGLGWFSIGLGVAQIAAPGAVARLIGVRDDEKNRDTMFAIGLREIVSGLGILAQREPSGWLQARVGGDAMDLALLGSALRSEDNDRGRVAAAAAAVAGVMALDVVAAERLSGRTDGMRGLSGASGATSAGAGIRVRQSITISRPVEEVYGFWRNFENLPRFMSHLEAVRVLDERRSRWTARAPAGRTVEWDAEIVEDRPNERIAWRSLPGADVPNAGQVRFTRAVGRDATEVHVDLRYDPPGGALGATLAKLFGEEPGQQVSGDLRRFKQVLETGEVVHSDASIHRGPHPARPAARPM